MGEPLTNGEMPHSKVLSHLSSYPVVHDSISAYKSNPYGQRSIEVAEKAFDRFAKPVLPYLQGPISIIKPYAEKADTYGDNGLSKVDAKFPVVKDDTEKVKQALLSYAQLPQELLGRGYGYLVDTYQDERQKTGGEGLFSTGKAIVSTELKVLLDSYHFVIAYLHKAKEEGSKKANEKVNEKTS